MNSGDDIQRKFGSGGNNKKRNQKFLKTVKIAKDPTISLRKKAAELMKEKEGFSCFRLKFAAFSITLLFLLSEHAAFAVYYALLSKCRWTRKYAK